MGIRSSKERLKKLGTSAGLAAALIMTVCFAGGCGTKTDRSEGLKAEETERIQVPEMESESERREPAYIYYVKDSNFMRADVNGAYGEERKPQLLAEAAVPNGDLKSYRDVLHSADGNFSAFTFDLSDPEDIWDTEESLVVVDHGSGAATELARGIIVSEMKGNSLFYQVMAGDDSKGFDAGGDFYEYTRKDGAKFLLGETNTVCVDPGSGDIAFTRLKEDREKGFLLSQGKEIPISASTAADETDGDNQSTGRLQWGKQGLYHARSHWSGDELRITVDRIGRDGTAEEILGWEDEAVNYYIDPDGSLYYIRAADNSGWEVGDEWNLEQELFYKDMSTGESRRLAEKIILWEALQISETEGAAGPFEEGTNILLCKGLGEYDIGLYAVVNGEVFPMEFPGLSSEQVSGCTINTTVMDGDLWLTLLKYNEKYEVEWGKIYQSQWTGTAFTAPKLAAEGVEATPLLCVDGGGLFWEDGRRSDGKYENTLYFNDQEILKGFVPGSLMRTGGEEAEYFALAVHAEEAEGQKDGWQEVQAPKMVRVSTAGSVKTFMEDVVLCEPWAEGLVILAGNTESYPYVGNLYFCSGQGITFIDEGVTVFFEHSAERFVDAVPNSWDRKGAISGDTDQFGAWIFETDGSGDQEEVSQAERVVCEGGSIEDQIYHCTAQGFTMDLSSTLERGGHFEVRDGIAGTELLYLDEVTAWSGFDFAVSEEAYETCENAEAYGQMMIDRYRNSLKQLGLPKDSGTFRLLSADDVILGGKNGYRLKIESGAAIITENLLYVIPQEEAGKNVKISGELNSEDETYYDEIDRLAESIVWEE